LILFNEKGFNFHQQLITDRKYFTNNIVCYKMSSRLQRITVIANKYGQSMRVRYNRVQLYMNMPKTHLPRRERERKKECMSTLLNTKTWLSWLLSKLGRFWLLSVFLNCVRVFTWECVREKEMYENSSKTPSNPS